MKKLLLLLVLISCTAVLSAQEYRTTYFMPGSTSRLNLNPAFRPYRGYIALPVIGDISVGYNGNVAYNDFFLKGGDLNYNETSRINANFSTKLLGVGFYSGYGFWDFGVGLNVDAGVAAPNRIIEFIREGNQYDSYNLDGTSFGVNTHLSLSVGYSYEILPEELTVGARVKFLVGVLAAKIHFDRLNISKEGGDWSVDAKGMQEIMISGIEWPLKDGYVDFSELNIDEDFKFRPSFAGTGFSVDLGVNYKLLETVDLSFSVLDLGYIKWYEKSSVRASQEATFTYDDIGEDDSVVDALAGLMGFDKGQQMSTKTKLKSKIVVGAELPFVDDMLSFGLIYMNKKGQYFDRNEFSAALTFRPVTWFSAAVSYTFNHVRNIGKNGINTVGVALNFSPSWINFFVGTDYMISGISDHFIPIDQKIFNAYAGISIPLGKKRY